VAADMDGNGKLTIKDEQLLMKVAIGMENAIDMWRFIPANHQFAEVAPFAIAGEIFDFPRSASINNIDEAKEMDFLGIRMGDLSGAAASARSSRQYDMRIGDQTVKAGEQISVILTLDASTAAIAGLVSVDLANARIVNVKQSVSATAIINPSANHLEMIWTSDKDLSQSAAIEITMIAQKEGQLSDMISLSKKQKSSLINSALENIDISLSFTQLGNLAVAISPNPFASVMQIEVASKQSQTGEIKIFNATGALVLSRNVQLVEGINRISLGAEALNNQSGIYRMVIQTDGEMITKSIILARQ
jgi:hypothetical protein